MQYARTIEGGHWDHRISPPMGFLENTAQMADGQHRCQAVIRAGRSIVVAMRIVPILTVGMDEGVGRTLADDLKIHADLSRQDGARSRLDRDQGALPHSQREQPGIPRVLSRARDFIMECVRKPIAWVADKLPVVTSVFKLPMLAVTRAQEIERLSRARGGCRRVAGRHREWGRDRPVGQSAAGVRPPDLESDPGGLPEEGGQDQDFIKWTRGALQYKREGVMKNAITTRFPGADKKRKKLAAQVVAA